MRTPLSLAAALLVAAPALAIAGPTPFGKPFERAGFERIAKRKGVKVYKHKTSSIIHLGAEGVINAPPAQVAEALLAYEKQIGVIKRLSKSKVLLRTKSSMTVYQRLNLPIISDRDFTLRVWWGQRGKVSWIRYEAQPNGLGGLDGAVHVKNHSGSWQLKPLNGGAATLCRFEVSIDMAGWLPRWMAKSGSGKEVPEVFGSIRKLIAQQAKGRRVAQQSATGK